MTMAAGRSSCVPSSKPCVFFAVCVLALLITVVTYTFHQQILHRNVTAFSAWMKDTQAFFQSDARPSEPPRDRSDPDTTTHKPDGSSLLEESSSWPGSRSDFTSRHPSSSAVTSSPYVRTFGPRRLSDRKQKRVLLWTLAWGEKWEGAVRFDGCPVSNCVVTSSRSEVDQSDAVIFYFTDMNPKDLPPRRNKEQVWIFYDLESPCLTHVDFRHWENVFNWTMTYRRDADVHSAYGTFLELSPEERAKVDYSWKNRTRTKFALWMATNCNSHSRRKDVVKELNRYVPVDTFGKCGARQLPADCGRYRDILCMHLLQDYKFYLAFENVICRDYVTEKVWNAFFRNQVPVVLGGKVDYEHLLPPESYISVSQFPDIPALAKYLKHLDTHPEEYNRYLSWKSKYKPVDDRRWCSLCEALHDASRPAQVYWNLGKWMFEDLDTCQCRG